jgi:hypothetical protein
MFLSAPRPSACSPIIGVDFRPISAKYWVDFHAFQTLKAAVSTIQRINPVTPSPAPYVHPISPKVTQPHPRIGRGTQSQPPDTSIRFSKNLLFACKGHIVLYIVFYSPTSSAFTMGIVHSKGGATSLSRCSRLAHNWRTLPLHSESSSECNGLISTVTHVSCGTIGP